MLRRLAQTLYTLAMLAFPLRHRRLYGRDMQHTFDRSLAARAQAGIGPALLFAVAAWVNTVAAGVGERRRERRAGPGPSPWRGLAAIARDLSHAVRALAAARAFTIVCVMSLGLGMATVMAILVFLRAVTSPPPGVDPRHLVEVLAIPEGPLQVKVGDWAIDTWSYPDVEDLLHAHRGLALTAWAISEVVVGRHDDDLSARVPAMYASTNYFRTVGVALARGAGFSDSADALADRFEVVIGHQVWQERLDGAADVIGRTFVVDGIHHVVVGVAPDRFRGHVSPEEAPRIQLWMPLARHPRLQPHRADSLRQQRDVDWLRLLGRLSPETSREQASAAVDGVMTGLAARFPDLHQHKRARVEPYSAMGARLAPAVTAVRAALFGVSSMVLLIVCLNVSGMVVVRSARRERELAVRLAVGASRGRLARYLLSESLLLALAGGALAAFLLFGVPRVVAWWLGAASRLPDMLRPDAWVVMTSVAVCFVTSLVFGLLPAIRFSRPSLISALKDELGGGGRRIGRVYRWTATVQAAVAVPLLVVSGVKIDQMRTTALADVGFDLQGLYAAPVTLDQEVARGRDAAVVLRTLLEDLRGVSGVEAVSAADGLPLDFQYRIRRVSRLGEARVVGVHTTQVAEDYFEAMKIEVRRGRGVTADDRADATPVAVVSEALARQLFAAEDPIGQRIALAVDDAGEPRAYTVIGVTGDVVTSQMSTARAQMFLPLSRAPASPVLLIARSSAGEAAMATAYRRAMAVWHSNLLPELVTGDRLLQRSLRDLASHSIVAGAAALVALTLAALGIYGVVGFMVATRTREIGVRMALGASRSAVLARVLADAVKVALPGIAIGTAIGAVLMRTTGGFDSWYPTQHVEPIVYIAAALIGAAAAILAGLPSARRAARVDPMLAMRSE